MDFSQFNNLFGNPFIFITIIVAFIAFLGVMVIEINKPEPLIKHRLILSTNGLNTWKCKYCDTENTGQKCINCGAYKKGD